MDGLDECPWGGRKVLKRRTCYFRDVLLGLSNERRGKSLSVHVRSIHGIKLYKSNIAITLNLPRLEEVSSELLEVN